MICHVVLVAKSQPLSMLELSKGTFSINNFLLVMVESIKMPKSASMSRAEPSRGPVRGLKEAAAELPLGVVV